MESIAPSSCEQIASPSPPTDPPHPHKSPEDGLPHRGSGPMIFNLSPLQTTLLRIFPPLRFSSPLSSRRNSSSMPSNSITIPDLPSNKKQMMKRGSVASIINNLHKLEYESGRMDHLAQPKTRVTLSSDHPAQAPRGDRPVPFHERPVLKHREAEDRKADQHHETHGFELPELRHVEHGGDHQEGAEKHGQEEKHSPFRRRDSTSSVVSTPPPKRRESISHKAFERVRSMSVSPTLAMPIPRVDVHPWNESAEQYIARKLTERWSPPLGVSPPRSHTHAGQRVIGQHVEAPFVQDILQNIDKILTEHTGMLKDVIDDSRRVLRDRTVPCYDYGGSEASYVPYGGGSEDARTEDSSVPDLMAAIDRTATHLGLSLPELHARHPERVAVMEARHITSSMSPCSTSPQEYFHVSRSLGKHHSSLHHVHESSLSGTHEATPAPSPCTHVAESSPSDDACKACRQIMGPSHHSASHILPSQRSHHSQHFRDSRYKLAPTTLHKHKEHGQNLPHNSDKHHYDHTHSNDCAVQEPEMLHAHHHDHQDRHIHDPYPLMFDDRTDNNIRISKNLPAELEAIELRAQMSPSPALIEYDRFAALADRASRNSVNDIVDTAAITRNTPDPRSNLREDTQIDDAPPSLAATGGSQHHEAAETKIPSSKLKDAWLKRSSDQAEKGKGRREGTMDRLKRQRGETGGVVEKRVKDADLPIKPIGVSGKRQTARMVDSIMTRQGRDKERSAQWKN